MDSNAKFLVIKGGFFVCVSSWNIHHQVLTNAKKSFVNHRSSSSLGYQSIIKTFVCSVIRSQEMLSKHPHEAKSPSLSSVAISKVNQIKSFHEFRKPVGNSVV